MSWFRDRGFEPEESEGSARGAHPVRAFCRGALLVVFLAGLALVFLVLAAPTQGFRSFAAAVLSRKAGVPVSIGACRIGWPYDLAMEDVAVAAEEEGGEAPLRIERARLSWRPWSGLTVALHAPRLRLKLGEDGEWHPESLSGFGGIRSAGDISDLSAPFRSRLSLRIKAGRLELRDAADRLAGSASDIALSMTPASLPGRQATHYHLAAFDVSAGGSRLRKLVQEWLATDRSAYVELDYTGEPRPDSGGREYWSRP